MDHFGHNIVLRDLATTYQDAMLQVPVTVHLPDATVPLFGATVYPVSISIVLVLATLLVGFRAGLGAVRLRRTNRAPAEVAWIFIGFTVVYVTIISIATEYGENQRFRAMIDPVLLGVFFAQLASYGLRLYKRSRAS